jgi:hypothetical protein
MEKSIFGKQVDIFFSNDILLTSTIPRGELERLYQSNEGPVRSEQGENNKDAAKTGHVRL